MDLGGTAFNAAEGESVRSRDTEEQVEAIDAASSRSTSELDSLLVVTVMESKGGASSPSPRNKIPKSHALVLVPWRCL